MDLAFLLLVAMTQIADPNAPELGEMAVPRVQRDAAGKLPAAAGDAWQLRIHPASERASPFELVRGEPYVRQQRLDEPALRERLAALYGTGAPRPLLAPHQDSRSQDLLDAAAAIEERWPERRRVLVGRLADR